MASGIDDGLFGLELDHAGKSTAGYVQELDKRMTALRRMYTYATASELLELVKSKIPKGRKFDKMAKAMALAEVGLGKKQSSFAVYLSDKSKRVRQIDTNKVLIYVRPRKTLATVKPGVKLLVDSGPWTVGTIPFWPSKKDAVVIQRKVDTKLVEKINAKQEKQRSRIKQELDRIGVRDNETSRSVKFRKALMAKTVPDVMFDALSLEFGSGTGKPLAIWRRSLIELRTSFRDIPRKYKHIANTLYDSRYKGWRNWPKNQPKISVSKAKSFVQFQNRLGY